MISQAELFQSVPSGAPYAKGSATSLDAALAAAEHLVEDQRDIYNYVLSRGEVGATYKEVMTALRLPSGTVCPRLWELRGKPGRDGKPREAGWLLVATVPRRGGAHIVVERRFYGKEQAAA